MELKEIKELMAAFDASESSFFELEQEGIKLKLKKTGGDCLTHSREKVVATKDEKVAAEEKASPKELDGDLVLAPLVGVFYSAPTPEDKPYVQVGDKVKSGQVLCLIEAMKMMSEITSPRDGVVKEIFVKNQDVVGFEEQLFLIGD